MNARKEALIRQLDQLDPARLPRDHTAAVLRAMAEHAAKLAAHPGYCTTCATSEPGDHEHCSEDADGCPCGKRDHECAACSGHGDYCSYCGASDGCSGEHQQCAEASRKPCPECSPVREAA